MASPETASVGAAVVLTAEDLAGDQIERGHALFGIVWANAQRMSGTPSFAGTRVPVQSLFDHLEAEDSLDIFLEVLPPVTRAQAVALLEISRSHLLDDLGARE